MISVASYLEILFCQNQQFAYHILLTLEGEIFSLHYSGGSRIAFSERRRRSNCLVTGERPALELQGCIRACFINRNIVSFHINNADFAFELVRNVSNFAWLTNQNRLFRYFFPGSVYLARPWVAALAT